jgi:hypothetical protein
MTSPIIHGDVIPLFMQPTTDPSDPPQICYGAADYRMLASAVFPGAGIIGVNDFQVSSNGTAILNVGIGTAMVAGTSAAEQHTYLCRNPTVKTIQPPGPPTTNNRYDLLCLTAHDGQIIGDHIYEWQVQCISGTQSASPTVPALPKDSIALAAALRYPGQANILVADLTDLRALAALPTQPKSQTYWKSESTANSANFSTVEARDATINYLKITVTNAAAIYRIRFIGVAQNSVAGRVLAKVRDGGSGNPTTVSAVVAQNYAYVGAGGNNNSGIFASHDTTLSVGTHIFGVFGQTSQAGNGVLVGAASPPKQLTVELVG